MQDRECHILLNLLYFSSTRPTDTVKFFYLLIPTVLTFIVSVRQWQFATTVFPVLHIETVILDLLHDDQEQQDGEHSRADCERDPDQAGDFRPVPQAADAVEGSRKHDHEEANGLQKYNTRLVQV